MTIVDTDVLIDFLSGKAPTSVDDALARGALYRVLRLEVVKG